MAKLSKLVGQLVWRGIMARLANSVQLAILGLIAVWVVTSSTNPIARAGERSRSPNVLFILADDLGIGDLSCYGNPVLETPVLDRLASQGVRLTNHYAPSPLCAPSRAGYLTGRYNHRTGAVDVPSNRGLDRIELSEKTFGDYFRNAGYRTALIGKWHNGLYCRDYLPHQRGFDLFFGFPNGGQDYWAWHLMRNDKIVAHDGRYLTDALNDEAISFIKSSDNQSRPFALFLAHHAPHQPFQAPEPLIEKYRRKLGDRGHTHAAVVYAMIEAMDQDLSRVFEAIRSIGEWDNTIIVFTSDNGAQLSGSGHDQHTGTIEGFKAIKVISENREFESLPSSTGRPRSHPVSL